MKTFLVLLASLALLGCTQVPDSAKSAYTAIKDLQAKTISGTDRADYGHSLSGTKGVVSVFLKSSEARKHSEVAKAMEEAISWYDLAWQVWQAESSATKGIDRTDGLGQVATQRLAVKDLESLSLPGNSNLIDPRRLLPLIWRRADMQVEVIGKLVAGNNLADISKEAIEGINRVKGGIDETRKAIDDVKKNLGLPSEKK